MSSGLTTDASVLGIPLEVEGPLTEHDVAVLEAWRKVEAAALNAVLPNLVASARAHIEALERRIPKEPA